MNHTTALAKFTKGQGVEHRRGCQNSISSFFNYHKDYLNKAEGLKKPLQLHNPSIKKLSPTDLGVKGLARQGWVIE